MKRNSKSKIIKDSEDYGEVTILASDKNVISSIKRAWKLEMETPAGKINWHCGLLLVILSLALTTKEWLIKIIALIVGAIKTWILKENVVEPYETTNAFFLMGSLIIFMAICIIILCVWDKNLKKISIDIVDKKNQ